MVLFFSKRIDCRFYHGHTTYILTFLLAFLLFYISDLRNWLYLKIVFKNLYLYTFFDMSFIQMKKLLFGHDRLFSTWAYRFLVMDEFLFLFWKWLVIVLHHNKLLSFRMEFSLTRFLVIRTALSELRKKLFLLIFSYFFNIIFHWLRIVIVLCLLLFNGFWPFRWRCIIALRAIFLFDKFQHWKFNCNYYN